MYAYMSIDGGSELTALFIDILHRNSRNTF